MEGDEGVTMADFCNYITDAFCFICDEIDPEMRGRKDFVIPEFRTQVDFIYARLKLKEDKK